MISLLQFRLGKYDQNKVTIQRVCHLDIFVCLHELQCLIHFCKRKPKWTRKFVLKISYIYGFIQKKTEKYEDLNNKKTTPQGYLLIKGNLVSPVLGWKAFKHKGQRVLQTQRSEGPPSSLKPGNTLVEPSHTPSAFSFLRCVRKSIQSFIQATIHGEAKVGLQSLVWKTIQ